MTVLSLWQNHAKLIAAEIEPEVLDAVPPLAVLAEPPARWPARIDVSGHEDAVLEALAPLLADGYEPAAFKQSYPSLKSRLQALSEPPESSHSTGGGSGPVDGRSGRHKALSGSDVGGCDARIEVRHGSRRLFHVVCGSCDVDYGGRGFRVASQARRAVNRHCPWGD